MNILSYRNGCRRLYKDQYDHIVQKRISFIRQLMREGKMDHFKAFESIQGTMMYSNLTNEERSLMIAGLCEIVVEGLSENEIAMIPMVVDGMTSKVIASKLSITKSSAETFRIRLLRKFDVANTAQLVAFAFRNKLVS